MILGIDIGTQGALALLSADGHLLEVVDMPVLRDGPKGRPAVNAPLLVELICCSHARQAFIEHVGARLGEGPVRAFVFGHSAGAVQIGWLRPTAPGMRCRTGFPTLQQFHQRGN